MKIVLVTGGFDPLHSGHISLFDEAKKLGEKLVVGLNSDDWLTRKKGKPFMPYSERYCILENIKSVDHVINFDDADDTATDAIQKVWEEIAEYSRDVEVIFANGGDRKKGNVPEEGYYYDDGRSDSLLYNNTSFAYGVGGNTKANSSSWILQEWKEPKTQRDWGYYRVLHENGPEVKVKELTVDPGKRLSMQRHEKRAEHWFVSEGEATVYGLDVATDITKITYDIHKSLHIRKGEWHMLANETDKPLKVVEIQYGEECVEEDIERK